MGKIVRKGIAFGSGSISGGNNEVVLSQAEYDALGDEKLTNDVTYYITDGVSESQAAIDELSSEVDEVKSGLDTINSNFYTKLTCPKNSSMEIVFSTWSMTVNANSTTSDEGTLANAIREWTGWSTIYILIPILQTNLPIYLTVQGDIVYAHNTKSTTYENVNIRYIALGTK